MTAPNPALAAGHRRRRAAAALIGIAGAIIIAANTLTLVEAAPEARVSAAKQLAFSTGLLSWLFLFVVEAKLRWQVMPLIAIAIYALLVLNVLPV